MVGKLEIEGGAGKAVPEYTSTIVDPFNGRQHNHPDEHKPEDMKMKKIKECLVIFIAEFLGTAVLMYSGCLCGVQFTDVPSPLAGALGFGFTVCMVISIFGPVSGAHVNPSVTLCAIIYGSLDIWMALVYVPAQILGALFGFGLLAVSMPWSVYEAKSAEGICMTLPLDGMQPGTLFLVEFALTAILILTCCGLWDRRSEKLQDSGAVKFGLTIAALSIAGGHLTGASMNPARSLAPAMWQGNYNSHWLYWLAPLSASVVTTLFWKYVLREDKKRV